MREHYNFAVRIDIRLVCNMPYLAEGSLGWAGRVNSRQQLIIIHNIQT